MVGENSNLDALIVEALASAEPIRKPQEIKVRPQGLLERIVLSRWTAPAAGAALAGLAYAAEPTAAQAWHKLAHMAIFASSGLLATYLLGQDWLLRKMRAVTGESGNFYQQLSGIVMEHPEIIAGAAAVLASAVVLGPDMVSLTSADIYKYGGPAGILGSIGFGLASIFSLGYTAVSLGLGRVLNPETAKTLTRATKAVINSYRERYDLAAKNITHLLETNRAYGKSTALQALLGQFQEFGNDARYQETQQAVLETDKTSYSARSDWIMRPFISLLANHPASKANNSGVNAFALGDIDIADNLFSSAIAEARNELQPHMLRAAFLRRTGRDHAANLEMRICAELIMQQPDIEFESIDGSRNEVFFAGNVALKRNRELAALEEEHAILEKFRRRFGREVIYPLPVYKRGDFYYLLSEKAISGTLLLLMQQKKARFEDFAQAIQLMTRLQRFGFELYRKGEMQLDDASVKLGTGYFTARRLHALEQIERFNGIKLPESYKDAIGTGSGFIDRALTSSRAFNFFTIYKDFNPKNVLKRLFGQMQVLDFEPQSMKLLPAQTDLVNLLEFAEYLAPEHIQRLIDIAAEAYARENNDKVEKEDFRRVYEFAALQWHLERLIYRPEEAAKARTEGKREAKKREQIYHIANAREHLETIIERNYVTGEDLDAAMKVKDELKHPIFADINEWSRLENAVATEKPKAILTERMPANPARLAIASGALAAIIGASMLSSIAVKSNLIPVLGTPVFRQEGRLLLATYSYDEAAAKIDSAVLYYNLEENSGRLRLLAARNREGMLAVMGTDDFRNADLAKFRDKAVLWSGGVLTLYDFVKNERMMISDVRYVQAEVSPNGLWIAATFEKNRGEDNTGIRLLRLSDLQIHKGTKVTEFPSAYSPQWSSDSSYLAFFSNNGLLKDGNADKSKARINTLHIGSGNIYRGPSVGGDGILAWSGTGQLAYVTRQAIYLTDPRFESQAEIRTKIGEVEKLAFARPDYLLAAAKTRFSVINLANRQEQTIDGVLQDVSEDGKVALYIDGTGDVFALDVKTAQGKNLTDTHGLRESQAVFSSDDRRIYVVGSSSLNCTTEGCPPSLFSLDTLTGRSMLLQQSDHGNLRYALIAP